MSSCSVKMPGGDDVVIAEASQRPTARDSAKTRATCAGLAAEAGRELLHERLGRAHAGAQIGERARLGAPVGHAALRLARRGGDAEGERRRDRARSGRGAARGRPRRRRRGPPRDGAARWSWCAAPMMALTSVGTTWRLGCTGTSSARRSSEKPTPRRDGVAPVAVRRRSGSRSSSSSSSVSTSPPSSSTPSSTRRSVVDSLADLLGEPLRVAQHVPRGLER